MIYVVQGPKNYLKLCDKPGARHNRFGLIENNGTLNIKLVYCKINYLHK